MKTTRFLLPSLILAATLTRGAGAESYRTDINPVLLYSQAFLVAPDLSQADRDFLWTNQWAGQKLPARFGELIQYYNNEFRFVRQAAHSTVPADWGIDWSQGPNTLLPHLARIKKVAQTAQLRAMWDLQNGDQTNACDDLVAALVMARNGSRDRCVISALVQFAGEAIVCSTIAANFNHFSQESLRRLENGIDAAPARGRVADCMSTEKFTKQWLVDKLLEEQKNNPENDRQTIEIIRKALFDYGDGPDSNTNLWQQILTASGGTSDGMIRLLRAIDPLYPRLAKILSLPSGPYEEQMKPFMADVRNSQNPFVTALFPAFEKCRPKEFAILINLAMVRAAIEYKLNGESGFRSVMDPTANKPFAMERFSFDGVDRGFELKSPYAGRGFQEVMIFVEKDGPAFQVNANRAGQPVAR